MDDMIEDHNPQVVPKQTSVIEDASQFVTHGQTSKHDKIGVLSENAALRQTIIRGVLGKEGVLSDTEMLNLALKAMKDQDSTAIALARITVEEESNASMAEMAKAIALQAAGLSAGSNAPAPIQEGSNQAKRNLELPPLTREFVPGETEIGTFALKESDLIEDNSSSENM